MNITGEFHCGYPQSTIRNLKIDDLGYIFITQCILSKALFCIPLDTEVFFKIDDVKKHQERIGDHYITITRLKEGNSPDCFNLTLTEDETIDEYIWLVHPSGLTLVYQKSGDWVCFENPPLFWERYSSHTDEKDDDDDENILVLWSECSVEELEKELDLAVNTEDYEKASKLRDEIGRRSLLKK